MLAIGYHVYIWQLPPQLSCSDTCQIWMWFEEPDMYFCHIENIAYGEINERSFRKNPHPRFATTRSTVITSNNINRGSYFIVIIRYSQFHQPPLWRNIRTPSKPKRWRVSLILALFRRVLACYDIHVSSLKSTSHILWRYQKKNNYVDVDALICRTVWILIMVLRHTEHQSQALRSMWCSLIHICNLAWRHQLHCAVQLQTRQNIWDRFLQIAAQGLSQCDVATQRTHDVIITLSLRQNDVAI